MSEYKLLLLDLDGTTVASNGEALPSGRVIEAVQAAQKKLHVALATGRPLPQSQPVIDALGLKGLSVLNGGAEIIDVSNGRVAQRQLLSVEAMRELVTLALPFGYPVYTDDDQYGQTIKSPDDLEHEAAKLFIEAVKNDDAVKLLAELAAIEGASAHPTTSWSPGDVVDIHITHEHATKRYGVARLMQMLGVSKDETMAIGDGHNDIPLLEAAGFKIAMGNAPNEVKAVADYIAPSLADDGVAFAIEKFVL